MDLNELLHAHQVAVMEASAAGDEATRETHFDQVVLYAERIRALRELRRAADRPPTRAESETIIYGTYAGDLASPANPALLSSWEGEGGALDPPATGAPPDIEVKVLRQYFVGPYTYSDFPLALAEHGRQRAAAARAAA